MFKCISCPETCISQDYRVNYACWCSRPHGLIGAARSLRPGSVILPEGIHSAPVLDSHMLLPFRRCSHLWPRPPRRKSITSETLLVHGPRELKWLPRAAAIGLAFASGIIKGCMPLCFPANQASMTFPRGGLPTSHVHPTIPILSESSHHNSFVTSSLPYARLLP